LPAAASPAEPGAESAPVPRLICLKNASPTHVTSGFNRARFSGPCKRGAARDNSGIKAKQPLRVLTCNGGAGPGRWHTCRCPRSWGPALVIHRRQDHADLRLDLHGHTLGPVALARALDLTVVYRLAAWAADAVMGASLLQLAGVPAAALSEVTRDLVSLAASVNLAPPSASVTMRLVRRAGARQERGGA